MSLVRQLNWEKALLIGAIGVAIWSMSVDAGQKILFSSPTVPIGAPLSEEELSKKILPKGPSMFAGPGPEILPPAASSANNNSRQFRNKSASKDLFDTNPKTDEDELNLGKMLEKSVSTESLLENTKNSKNSPFDRAWDDSPSSDPWKDVNDSSKEPSSSSRSSYALNEMRHLRNSDSRNSRGTRDLRSRDSKDSRSSEGTRDSDNSRNNHDSIAIMDNSDYSTSAFKDDSNQRWNNKNPLGDSMVSQTSTILTRKETLDQKSLRQDYTKMFNEMADSTSPLGSSQQDMTNSIHDSMWQLPMTGNILPSFDRSPYSLTPRSAVSDSPFSLFGQSPAPAMKGSTFNTQSFWGNETSGGNSLLQSQSISAPEQKKPQDQPTILSIPKRPGQL